MKLRINLRTKRKEITIIKTQQRGIEDGRCGNVKKWLTG
jgi:hypothetical protein